MGSKAQPEVLRTKNGAHHMTSDVLKNLEFPLVPFSAEIVP